MSSEVIDQLVDPHETRVPLRNSAPFPLKALVPSHLCQLKDQSQQLRDQVIFSSQPTFSGLLRSPIPGPFCSWPLSYIESCTSTMEDSGTRRHCREAKLPPNLTYYSGDCPEFYRTAGLQY